MAIRVLLPTSSHRSLGGAHLHSSEGRHAQDMLSEAELSRAFGGKLSVRFLVGGWGGARPKSAQNGSPDPSRGPSDAGFHPGFVFEGPGARKPPPEAENDEKPKSMICSSSDVQAHVRTHVHTWRQRSRGVQPRGAATAPPPHRFFILSFTLDHVHVLYFVTSG